MTLTIDEIETLIEPFRQLPNLKTTSHECELYSAVLTKTGDTDATTTFSLEVKYKSVAE